MAGRREDDVAVDRIDRQIVDVGHDQRACHDLTGCRLGQLRMEPAHAAVVRSPDPGMSAEVGPGAICGDGR